jgi:hypothetical protein
MRRNNETVPDCAWCGAECNQPRPYANGRGELFCSPSHRSSSNRALARLTGEGAPKPAPKPRRNGAERVTVPGMGTGVVVAHRPGGMCDIRLSGGQVVRKSKSTLKPA